MIKSGIYVFYLIPVIGNWLCIWIRKRVRHHCFARRWLKTIEHIEFKLEIHTVLHLQEDLVFLLVYWEKVHAFAHPPSAPCTHANPFIWLTSLQLFYLSKFPTTDLCDLFVKKKKQATFLFHSHRLVIQVSLCCFFLHSIFPLDLVRSNVSIVIEIHVRNGRTGDENKHPTHRSFW